MKYVKYMAFLAMVVGLVSCGNDDDKITYNDAKGVTVSMEKDEIDFMESQGIVNVPIKVTGEANGYVTVTCSVEEAGSNPAMDDVHYLVTSTTVNIAPGDSIGKLEISLVDDREINPDRNFIVKLVNAEGATIEGIAQTFVTLVDNDDKPYDRLAGVWYCKYIDLNDSPAIAKINIRAYNPGEYGYGASYMVENLLEGFGFRMLFKYNEATAEGSCQIQLPNRDVEDLSDGSTNYTIQGVNDEFSDYANGTVIMEWNEDITELNVVSAPLEDHFNLFLTSDAGGLDAIFHVKQFSRDMPKD